MDKQEIIDKLTPIFREIFENPSLDLMDDMTPDSVEGWESITHMMLVERIEQEFGIKFKLIEMPQLTSVGNIVGLLSSKI